MLRTDTASLFERLREANILLQEVMSRRAGQHGAARNRAGRPRAEFATVMNDVTARTGAGHAASCRTRSRRFQRRDLQGGGRPVGTRAAIRRPWPRAGAGGRTGRRQQPQGRRLDRRAPRPSRLAGLHARSQERGTRAAAQALLEPARRIAGKFRQPRARHRPPDRRNELAGHADDRRAVRPRAQQRRGGTQAHQGYDAEPLRSGDERHARRVPPVDRALRGRAAGHQADGRRDAERARRHPRRIAQGHPRNAGRKPPRPRRRCAA